MGSAALPRKMLLSQLSPHTFSTLPKPRTPDLSLSLPTLYLGHDASWKSTSCQSWNQSINQSAAFDGIQQPESLWWQSTWGTDLQLPPRSPVTPSSHSQTSAVGRYSLSWIFIFCFLQKQATCAWEGILSLHNARGAQSWQKALKSMRFFCKQQ